LEQLGAVKKGTVVIGDNIICPGSPDYLKHFKENTDFDSTLYHSYLEYTNYPDAVLVS
jgi:catechol O-methyltransferase